MDPEQLLFMVYQLLHHKYTQKQEPEEPKIHDSIREGSMIPEDIMRQKRQLYIDQLTARNGDQKPSFDHFRHIWGD